VAHQFAREEAFRPVVRFIVIARTLRPLPLGWPSSVQPPAW
jgi:hypothetical protein